MEGTPIGTSLSAGGKSKRVRDEVEELLDQVSRGGAEGEEDEPRAVRRRVREDEMPWHNTTTSSSRRASCVETCRTLLRFSEDLSGVKSLLRVADNLPGGIPSSQWDRMLRGESVDLNQILSSMHFIQLDEERKGRLGTAEVVFSVAESKKQVKTGAEHQLSGGCPRESRSSSPIVETSSSNTLNISKGYSPPNTLELIPKSSSMTNQSAIRLEEDKTHYSPTTTTSGDLTKPSFMPMELSTRGRETERALQRGTDLEKERGRKRSVEDLMGKQGVDSLRTNAITSISAKGVERVDTENPLAPQRNIRDGEYGMRPKYLRYNIWDPDSDFSPNTSDWTKTAAPLEGPPQTELDDEVVTKTIRDNPDLFKIITPIRVDVFESYLSTHPNRPFVESVCRGLREGFWPWAKTPCPGYPSTNDESKGPPSDIKKAEFLRVQRDSEVAKGRFSAPFRHGLLPGMYCMPIYAVPKPHSADLRLVTDQSYGKYSPNSMIQHHKVTGFPLDNLVHFGEMLLDLETREPGKTKIAWKSDVAEAYRILPMHPRWQIKQVTRVDDDYHVDRCNVFGGCGAGGLFISVNSLVAWIAKEIKGIQYLGNYVDDSSGCGIEGDNLTYEPYGKDFPRDQVILLNLWDELGIPHKPHKQIYGSPLPVIGITVDVNELSFSFSEEAKAKLVTELQWWCKPGRKEKLRRWYQMGGWVNWALNVYPRLRPALNNFYPKLKGRRDSSSLIWVNNSIRDDFSWAIKVLNDCSGVYLLRSISWSLEDATLTLYCDACPEGMGFWYPTLNVAYYSPTPYYENPSLIFYFEALCVHSALFDAHRRTSTESPGRFVIYTDNLNTVDIFSTLRALPPYNHLLKMAIDILSLNNNDLRVLHVPGVDNAVADALSRADFQRALSLAPGLQISTFDPWSWSPDDTGSLTFQPPRGTLGAAFL